MKGNEIMDVPNFKYFKDFLKNATFTDIKCDLCSATDYCLEGEYFDNDEMYQSVCIKCLLEGKAIVKIPGYIIKNLEISIKSNNNNLSDVEIKKNVENKIYELSKTPPVAWIQFNNWPVLNGDFARFIGEWGKDEIINNTIGNDPKEYLKSILDELSLKGIDNFDIFWDDIGDNTAVYVFESIDSLKLIAVSQNY